MSYMPGRVALHSHDDSPALADDLAAAERLLLEMILARGDSSRLVLERASQPTMPVPELVRIKELAKLLIREAADANQRHAAQLLYHVSVASAFVHHDAQISTRPARKQHTLYERFAERWGGHPLGELFRRTAARAAGEDRTPE